MELETQVANTLASYGYPIFYRNLRLRHHGFDIAELDIVSTNFIVEVKTGRFENRQNKGFNVFYRHNLLPKQYVYFVYTPATSDAEIATLHSMYSRNPSYRFINRLDQIRTVIPPLWSASITSDKVFRRIVQQYFNTIALFQHLYIPHDVFSTVYTWLLRQRDLYHKQEAAQRLDALNNLVKEHIIQFEPTPSLFTYPIRCGTSSTSKYHLKELEPVSLEPCYYIQELLSPSSPSA